MQLPFARYVRAAAIAAALVAATAAAAQKPVLLRMKWRQGETLKYQTTMQIAVAQAMQGAAVPVNAATSMRQEWHVTKVLANGSAEVTVTTLSATTVMNGRPGAGMNVPPYTMVYDATGHVLSMRGLQSSNPISGIFGGSSGGSSMLGATTMLPVRPVRPGDTWEEPVKIPGLTGGSGGTMHSTYVRDEQIGRYQTASIRTHITMPLHIALDMAGKPAAAASAAAATISATLDGVIDANFAITEGTMVRTAGNMTASMSIEQRPPAASAGAKSAHTNPQAMHMTMKMTIATALVP